MKQISKKLALRSESIRRLNQTGLTQVRGGKKKVQPTDDCPGHETGADTGEQDSFAKGSGAITPITTLVRHQV